MGLRSVIGRIPHAKRVYRQAKRAYRFVWEIRAKAVFEDIYRRNYWCGLESRSGQGSGLSQTRVVRAELPKLIQELGIASLLDIPCGDFNWMQHVELGKVSYIGGDIVPRIVAVNQRGHGSETRQFRVLDVTRDTLPRADLILCRDCLVHLSFRLLRMALANLKRSGSRYLLTTTFPEHNENADIPTGSWFPLNLNAAPFGFPAPLRLINEQHPKEDYRDKSLALWALDSLPFS